MKRIEFHKDEKDTIINKNELIKNREIKHQNTIDILINIIKDYFSGDQINLANAIDQLDLDLDLEDKFQTSFSLKIAKALLSLKYGELTTYSKIGKMIGSKAYRAIGNVIRSNPIPLILPCHRVVKKSGEIGGFMGETRGGWEQDLKKRLIILEQNNKQL